MGLLPPKLRLFWRFWIQATLRKVREFSFVGGSATEYKTVFHILLWYNTYCCVGFKPMGLKLDRKEIKLCTVSWWRTNADNRRMKIQRRVDTSIIVKYIMIFKMDGGRVPSQFPSNLPRSASKPRKNHNFTHVSPFQFTFYFLKFRCII